jgi:hypothetical protein
VNDFHLRVDIVDLVLKEGGDQKTISPQWIDVHLLGPVVDGSDFALDFRHPQIKAKPQPHVKMLSKRDPLFKES